MLGVSKTSRSGVASSGNALIVIDSKSLLRIGLHQTLAAEVMVMRFVSKASHPVVLLLQECVESAIYQARCKDGIAYYR